MADFLTAPSLATPLLAAQRRIGLIGGTSWTSTATYYSQLNLGVQQRLGGSASAEVTIHSVNFDDVARLQQAGDWPAVGKLLAQAAASLERGGAQAVAVCANTLHLVADHISAAVSVPFIDLIDLTAKACSSAGVHRVALLGTQYTMQSQMYPDRLAAAGIEVLTPVGEDAKVVHDVIYTELARAIVNDQSRQRYLQVIDRLIEQGADAVVLGCTEIGLLIKPEHTAVPLLDTTEIHCAGLLDFMLADGSANQEALR